MASSRGFKFMEVGGSGRPAPWLVSFGDLLTLLLCFVLSLVCYGHFSPRPNTQTSAGNDAENGSAGQPLRGGHELGTPLAHSLPGAHPRDERLALFFAELDFRKEALDGGAEQRLHGFLGKALEGTVTIEACSGNPDSDFWFSSMAHALTLRGAVLKAGASGEQLRTRVLGGHCSELRSRVGAPPGAIAGLILQADEGNG